MNIAQAEVSLLAELPPKTKELVVRETDNILATWKRTVEGIIQIGKSLNAIRDALPNAVYAAHIKEKLGLNEMQASRFISVHRRFSNVQSAKVLHTKVSVLYLLATAPDLEKVERLASGGTVVVSGQRKSIDELRVEDAIKIRKGPKKQTTELSPAQAEKKRAAKAHEEVGELATQLIDWSADITRWAAKGVEIEHRKLLIESLKEAKTATDSCIKVLCQ